MTVDVSNIIFGYTKKNSVLDGVSFNVKDGEVFGILGSSGCGKSTLLRIISGILNKNETNIFSGSILVDGNANTQKLRKHGMIGLMFQQSSLLPNLTLEENILLPTMMNKNLTKDGRFASELIKMVGLCNYKDYLPKQLSGGMQKRAELIRTFITKPRLLLLDEPFSSLDYAWKVDLYARLAILIQEFKSTAIIVSHDINELILLANRIIILSKSGQILEANIQNDTPKNLTVEEIGTFLTLNNKLIVSIQTRLLNDKYHD